MHANKQIRALMVEDSEDDALLLDRELRQAGYDVTCQRVDSAAAMRQALRADQWDVVLCDHRMPGFDSLAALAICKEYRKDVPFIIVSGAIGEETAVAAMKAGAHDYILKSNLSRLAPAVKREMENVNLRRAEEKSEQKLRLRAAILDEISDVVIVTDNEGRVTYWNHMAEARYGTTATEAAGRLLEDLFRWQWINPQDQSDASDCLQRHGVWCGQVVHVKAGGEDMQVEVEIRHLRDDPHRPAGRLYVMRDITRRVRMARTLAESEERFRKVFDEGPLGMALAGRDYRFLRANASFCRMLGYTEAEMTRMTFRDITHPEHLETDTENVRKLWRGELPSYRTEKRYVRKDGQPFWAATTVSVLRDPGGESVVALAMIENINARKEAEQALLDAERKYHTMFEQAADSIVLIDLETGDIADFNDQTCLNLGYTRGEFQKVRIPDFEVLESPEAYARHLEKIMKQGADVFETRHRRRDGTIRDVLVNTRVLEIRGRKFLHAIWMDITERKQMEADLRSAIIRLQELDRIRSDFVHNVSHELKTPVASIMYAARNLVRGVTGSLPEKAVRYVRLIEGESLRLSRTVEDILDMRMLETHTLQLARTRLPIARVVGRLAEILQTQAKERRLRLMITADPRAGFVNCDAEKIERVFQNILTNALKFTPAGGAVEVTVCRDPEDHARVLIAVEDNGIGIPPEALPRVTERYFRAGNHPRGAGLGLSIAAELVHLHDGTLELLSPPPGKKQGTLVYLRLPVANPAVILVVDDNTATRDTVQRHLASYGFIVILADGEEESLTQADKEKPDGVILNAATGYDAAIHLKRYKALRDIPAVAVAEGPLDKPTQKVFDDLAIPVVPTLIHRNALVDTLEDVLVGRSVFAERTDSDPERRAPHERKQRADRAGR